MIRVGIAGIGFMGMIHYLSYQKRRAGRVVALCDRKPSRLQGDWRDIQGNFGPPGKKMDLAGIAVTSDWEALIADPEVDVVDICLPPAAHAEVAVAAMRAGKHVFCEKPMALRSQDAARMGRVAAETGQHLMIGHVLPKFPEYQHALSLAESGRYGRALGGHFRRVISDPQWLPHYYDPQIIGGPMLDLHIHDAHFIRLLLGVPSHVMSVGRLRGEVAEYFTTQFHYESTGACATADGGVIHQPARPFLHGFEIHFERATLAFEFQILNGEPCATLPLTLIPASGKARTVKVPPSDPMVAFEAELKAVLRGCASGNIENFLSPEPAMDAMRMCQKQTESLRGKKRVRVGSVG